MGLVECASVNTNEIKGEKVRKKVNQVQVKAQVDKGVKLVK